MSSSTESVSHIKLSNMVLSDTILNRWMHGAPYCGHQYLPLRWVWGGGWGEVTRNSNNENNLGGGGVVTRKEIAITKTIFNANVHS